ncbi:MAG TPA: oligosaccharide flippase family protein, partial [Solirubrobacterales bacterium]|nr:oligosaccharide flippase family protein [Solirubrobacterales bacterium]
MGPLRKLMGARGGAPSGNGSATADYGKTASFLAVGVGLTGVITYVYFFIASHVLSTTDYGQIAVLWSAVFITISTLYRPVEQLLSRHISEHLAKGEAIAGTTRNAATIQLGLAALFAVLALALRGPLQDDLLEGNETLYWIFFGAVLFYAASYFARGFLAGQKRFGLFTALILSESCFRTLFAVLVAVSLLSGQSWVAVGIVAAPSLSLMVVPLAFARGARSAPAPPPASEDTAVSMAHGTGFAAAVLVIMFSEQAFLNAGPLVARGLEGAAAAGFIFNVLMLARAPLQLFQAVSTSILPHLTGLHTSKEPGSEDEFHRSVRMVLIGIAAFTAVMALAILAAGPQLMQLAFSNKYSYDRAELLVVA